MIPIIRKSLPLILCHMATYTFLGIGPLTGKLDSIVIMSMMLPLWVSSTILWVEFGESEPFLRTLPITHKEIVRTKFGLTLCFVSLYGCIQLFVAMPTGIMIADPEGTISLVALSLSASLIVGGVSYIAIWFVGFKQVVPVFILFQIGCLVWMGMLLNKHKHNLEDSPVWQMMEILPLPLAGKILAVAVVIYYVLTKVAVRVRQLEA